MSNSNAPRIRVSVVAPRRGYRSALEERHRGHRSRGPEPQREQGSEHAPDSKPDDGGGGAGEYGDGEDGEIE